MYKRQVKKYQLSTDFKQLINLLISRVVTDEDGNDLALLYDDTSRTLLRFVNKVTQLEFGEISDVKLWWTERHGSDGRLIKADNGELDFKWEVNEICNEE